MGKSLKFRMTAAKGIIAVICLIVGFVITLQIKSVVTNSLDVISTNRLEVLTQQLVDERNRYQGLFLQAQDYKKQIENYEEEAAGQSEENRALVDKLREMEIAAGTADVEGPGIVVKIDDATNRPEGSDPNLYIIHDSDLLSLINELKNAGAEAISINGERLISTSAVRCAGNNITINGQTKVPPFEVRAIGNSETLYTALNMQGGIIEKLKLWLEISCTKAEKVTVPRYTKPISFENAKPVDADSVSNEQ